MVKTKYSAALIPFVNNVVDLVIDIQRESDLLIWIYGPNVNKTQIPTEKYTLVKTPIKTTVTIDRPYFDSMLTAGFTHVLYLRDTEIDQVMNASASFPLDREAVEKALDRITLILQEHKYNIQNMMPRLSGGFNLEGTEWRLEFNDLNGATVQSPNLIGPTPEVLIEAVENGVTLQFQQQSNDPSHKIYTQPIYLNIVRYDNLNDTITFLGADGQNNTIVNMPNFKNISGGIDFFRGPSKIASMLFPRSEKVENETGPDRVDIYGANNTVEASFIPPKQVRSGINMYCYGGNTMTSFVITRAQLQQLGNGRTRLYLVSDDGSNGDLLESYFLLPNLKTDPIDTRKITIQEADSEVEVDLWVPSIYLDVPSKIIHVIDHNNVEKTFKMPDILSDEEKCIITSESSDKTLYYPKPIINGTEVSFIMPDGRESDRIDLKLNVQEEVMNGITNSVAPLEKNTTHENITDDYELFIDGTSSVQTSKGRLPIEGMNGGTYIPAKIIIDGQEYNNPSNIGGDTRGSYGFFSPWYNRYLRDSGWNQSNGCTHKFIGDWEEIAATEVGGLSFPSVGTEGGMTKFGILIKKINTSLIYFGEATAQDCSYDFSTNIWTQGISNLNLYRAVQLSESLTYLELGYINSSNFVIKFAETGQKLQFKMQYIANTKFIPPYGVDGNPIAPKRTYNYSSLLGKTIRFKFRPFYDISVESNKFYIGSYLWADASFPFYFSSDVKNFVYSDGPNTMYIWHNGISWLITSAPGSAITQTLLQQEHEIIICIAFSDNKSKIQFNDSLVYEVARDWSGFIPIEVLNIGGISTYHTPGSYYSDSIISDFCIFPDSVPFETIKGKIFKDPNKQYGLNGDWHLNKWGDCPASITKEKGALIKKGWNTAGYYRIYEDGFKECWFSRSLVGIYGETFNYPIAFNDKPALSAHGLSPTNWNRVANVVLNTATQFRVEILAYTTATSQLAPSDFELLMYACGY